MLFARSCAAFAKAGLGGTAPRIQMIVDLRRYLPPGRTVEGNFVCGTVLHPTNAGDSVSMYRAIQESTSTARPLAALALSSVRAGVVGPRSKVAATVRSAPPEPELVFSNLGALDALDDLPWAASRGDRRVVVTGSETGPEEITISFAECFEALHVTARFHSTTFDSEAVQSAVDIMCRD
jgi:hypothetical protein